MVALVKGAAKAQALPMVRFALTFATLLLAAACVASDTSVQRVDGRALRVDLVEDFYWAESPADHPEVEVFPLVTALVVSDPHRPMSEADGAAARAAATAHCRELGISAYNPRSRFSDGTWAFSNCG